ncbi:hypothetical protein F5878DRAFT_721737 [Lentinula raphanica]|uniref:Uncharacterized protein n=1 Tax=Lentinula raphanica TaxID=153919 RepID=A0AA38UJ12_9AGAR|nr:hypothetical protein F5878DRAFT_721737 [Lentinula raphanica]
MSIVSAKRVRDRLSRKLELSNLHDRLAMITSIIPHDHSYTQDDITLYLSMGQENIETWAAEDLPRLGVQSVLVHEACKIVYQRNHAASTSYSTPRDHDPATTNVQPNTDSPPQDPESPLSCPPVERSKWSSDTDDYAMSSDDHDDDSSSSIPSKRVRDSQEVAAGKKRRVEVDRESPMPRGYSSSRSGSPFLRNKTKPRTKRISGSEGSVAALSAFEPALSSTATAFKIQSNEELLMNISTASGQELDLTFANDSALSLDTQQLALPDSSMQSLGAPSESPVQQSSSVSASSPPDIVSPIASPDSETHALSINPLPVAGSTVEESNQLQATSRSLPQQSTSSISMSDSRNRTIKPKHPTSKVSRASYTIENSPVKRNSAFGSVANAIEHFNAVGIARVAPQVQAARPRRPQADPAVQPNKTMHPQRQPAQRSDRSHPRISINSSAKPLVNVNQEYDSQLDHIPVVGVIILLMFLDESYPSLPLYAVMLIAGCAYICLGEMVQGIRRERGL